MKVRIQTTAEVQYDQTFEMTKVQYMELTESIEDGDNTIVEAWVKAHEPEAIDFDAINTSVHLVKAGKPKATSK